MMKDHGEPMVTITQEHYAQLQECKALINILWRHFAFRSWPKEFRLPKGTTWKDLFQPGREDERDFYQFESRVNNLMDFDDGE